MRSVIPREVLTRNAQARTNAVNVDPNVDAVALAAELQSRITGEVRFDDGSRALYTTDSSNYRQVPIGVVLPRTKEDVIAAVEICRKYNAPILPRGCGTSLAGQTCNVAVVLDMSKYMNQVLEVDPDSKMARVQPGVVLDDLRDAAEKYQLTFGPDPATHDHCTLGGMIGNNSCGTHSVMAGMTDENIEELEIITYDGVQMRVGKTSEEELEKIIQAGGRRGEIYAKMKALRDKYADLIRAKYPNIPRRVSGYNLVALLPENGFNVARALVGGEGTLVTVLEAKTKLVHSPPARTLVVLGYSDIYTACDHVPELLKFDPIALEGFGERMAKDMNRKKLMTDDVKLLPPGNGWLLIEFGAEKPEEAKQKAQKLIDSLKDKDNAPHVKFFENRSEQARIWKVREAALGATSMVPGKPDTWPGWEDSAVPPEKLGDYLRQLRKILDKYGYDDDFYGHFGQGCVHGRIDFDLTSTKGIADFRSFMREAAELVVQMGGSLSGEHGDGQARAELLPIMFGDELIEVFNEFKKIWDPNWKMNPGKVAKPYRVDENLRLGANYNPPSPPTYFRFLEDNGNFARAAQRCVGVGKCRKHDSGTMCPSYMATHEEAYSTRGRARLLFEMLEGFPLRNGWKDKAVKEALDFCLACKACKHECPVNVDMATYKSEFLSHYYAGKLRPRTAYSMGLIYWWAGFAKYVPWLVNLLSQAPLTSNVAKKLAGIAPQRKIPKFANQTFKQWFEQRGTQNTDKSKVILWPDTFNNHFHPDAAKAAVEVLEQAGWQVIIPKVELCCGRPLYDWGMINPAKMLLRQILVNLKPEIEAGTEVVGLEPSCVSVFRDELINLFPNDEDAKRLSKQTFMLSEFLEKHNYEPPKLKRKAVVHGHCHHKSVLDIGAEENLLKKLGLDYKLLDDGCCGMAGAFGFEKEHYDVSIACGERVLLPAVRETNQDELIITDGFSCHEQIVQCTERKPLHVSQVLQMALHDGQDYIRPADSAADSSNSEKTTTQPPTQNISKILKFLSLGAIIGSAIWIRRKL